VPLGTILLAGFTNEVGFLQFNGLYISFVIANSTRLGAALAGDAVATWLPLTIVVAFVGEVTPDRRR
jgi:uncharacterized membrane protein YoaK (UPF0700 family)